MHKKLNPDEYIAASILYEEMEEDGKSLEYIIEMLKTSVREDHEVIIQFIKFKGEYP